MKKNRIVYLGLLGAMLFGCSNNVTSSSSSNTHSSSTSTIEGSSSSVVSSILSSNNSNSSSLNSSNSSTSSSVYLEKSLTQEMVDELASGYQVLGLYTSTVKGQVTATNYYSYNCTDMVYEFTAWEEVLENPTRDKVSQSYRYEGFTYGTDTAYLSQAKLNLNNEVVNYLVTDGYGNLLKWNDTGFANAFLNLDATDFVPTENEFEFSLTMGKLSLTPTYRALTSQFSSYMGLTMTSFKIKTDGQKIKSYFMDFETLTTMSGQMYITVEGEFTKSGSDVVKPLEPMKGVSDDEFDEIFEILQEQNYRLDVDLGVKSYKMALEDGKKLIYDEFDKNGLKTSSYGYYQMSDSLLQGVTKINDTIYVNSAPVAGSLINSVLPTLRISSVLFTYNEEESTEEKKVYTFREDAPKDIAHYYDYGMMAGSIVGDLTIILEEGKVTIQNKLSLSTEQFVYYDIGKVTNLFGSLKKTCDELKWSELLSNQVKELETLYKIIPQEALDLIPTIGGTYSHLQLNASYKPKVPVITIPVSDSNAGNQLYTSFSAKLLAAGFELSVENSTDILEAYTKACQIDGVDKKVCVKIYFAADYLSGAQFVIYPSIID